MFSFSLGQVQCTHFHYVLWAIFSVALAHRRTFGELYRYYRFFHALSLNKLAAEHLDENCVSTDVFPSSLNPQSLKSHIKQLSLTSILYQRCFKHLGLCLDN